MLFIIKGAGDELPEGKELNLTLGMEFHMVEYFITFKVKAKEVVHVDMEAGDPKLSNSYP